MIGDARQKSGFEHLSNFPEKTWFTPLTPVGCKEEKLKLHRKQARLCSTLGMKVVRTTLNLVFTDTFKVWTWREVGGGDLRT